MSVNLLAISVGNTNTRLGVFVDGELKEARAVGNDVLTDLPRVLKDVWGALGGTDQPAVYLASVNEPAAQRVTEAVTAALGEKPVRMERDEPIPIGRQLDQEAIVGEDRLLNAAAAYDQLKQACIVIDAGTAVTVDFVDGAGTFHGGAILPGTRMMLSSLHHRADMLPQLEFERPVEAIGHNTNDAMLSGVYHGVRGAVRELTERYAEFYRAYPQVVATGGDAESLFDHYDLIESIVPNLTLMGMAVTRRMVLEGAG